MSNQTLLQQVRGCMMNIEPLTEENFSKISKEGVTYQELKEVIERAGLSVDKIIVDPERDIFNVYYADYESGLYFEIFLQKDYLYANSHGPEAHKRLREEQNFLESKDWHSYYFISVPTPLRVYDFQKRYKDIEKDKVFEVWCYIHKNIDYANDQWKPDVLKYVFENAPMPEKLPLNENGKVSVFRGCGTKSQPPELAMSWSSNQRNALWFANHNGAGQALYTGEVAPENVVAYFASFAEEYEVVVKPGTVENVQQMDMIPVSKDNMIKLLSPILFDLAKYGKYAKDFGYESEGIFGFHGRKHILRVLTLSLIMCFSGEFDLTRRDKNVLIYFALLHDYGRANEIKDDRHGTKAVRMINANKIAVPDLDLPPIWVGVAKQLIRYHSLPDEQGYQAIENMKRLSRRDRERVKLLFEICKDADGLDRVRINDLDISQLRTDYAKRMPLVAGALLQENVEGFIEMINKDITKEGA